MPVQRKVVAVVVSLLTHLLLLWGLLPHALKAQTEAGVMSASLVDGDALTPAASLPRPSPQAAQTDRKPRKVTARPDVAPLPVAEPLPPVDVTAEPLDLGDAVSAHVAAAAAAAITADGDPCAIGAWLQAALQNDPGVQSALATIPRSARSVANAVMLWNGEWPPPPSAGAASGMAQIRALVVAGVASAPESCQSQPISGPVLIAVGDPANATLLAVGSGQWRWQDLLPAPTLKQ